MGDFDTTLGALCIAYAVAWGLFGVMSTQTLVYFQKFPEDAKWLKVLVTCLWLLDTLQLVLIGHALYTWVITNYANPAILTNSIWSFNIGILVTNGIVLIVELFLTRRVFILSNGNRLLAGIIVLLSFCYFGFEMAVQVRTFQIKRIALFFEFQWIASVGLACAATADLMIAAALVYYLLKSRTGIKTTDSIVNRLTIYAMNTGLLTSIVVLIDMICFLTMPKNLIHIAFNIVVGKLYTNSLLASLNFRDAFRGKNDNVFSLSAINDTGNLSDPTFRVRTGTAPDDSFLSSNTGDGRTINISKTIETSRDGTEFKFEQV